MAHNFFEKLSDIFKKYGDEYKQETLKGRYDPLPVIKRDNVPWYQVVKQDGNVRKRIAWNLTLPEAKRLKSILHDRMLGSYGPNTIGEAYFKIEQYEIGLNA